MTNKSYVLNFSIIIAVSAALLAFIFILVSHHRTMPERVQKDRGGLLATGSSTPEMTRPVEVPAAKPRRTPAKKAKAASGPR